MKRSQINSSLVWAANLLASHNITLPRFAYWSMEEWKKNKGITDVISTVMQGWDITDFGSGDFEHVGAVLFTVRNGSLTESGMGTPYAEKYIMLEEGQQLPLHYHAVKTEDIINKGGGLLSLTFYNSKQDGTVDYESDVEVYSDGIKLTCKAGEELIITRGNSATITPGLYHLIAAKAEALIIGEVSSVNDDKTDNYFAEKSNRFARIEEDELPVFPLCNEYDKV